MRNGTGSAAPNAALVVAVIALIVALSGGALALQGRNSVDAGDIKKNAVTAGKQLKVAYLYIDIDGNLVRDRNVKGLFSRQVGGGHEMHCLDLKFKPKTGSATLGSVSIEKAPHIALGNEPSLHKCEAPFTDAAVYVNGDGERAIYASFFG